MVKGTRVRSSSALNREFRGALMKQQPDNKLPRFRSAQKSTDPETSARSSWQVPNQSEPRLFLSGRSFSWTCASSRSARLASDKLLRARRDMPDIVARAAAHRDTITPTRELRRILRPHCTRIPDDSNRESKPPRRAGLPRAHDAFTCQVPTIVHPKSSSRVNQSCAWIAALIAAVVAVVLI